MNKYYDRKDLEKRMKDTLKYIKGLNGDAIKLSAPDTLYDIDQELLKIFPDLDPTFGISADKSMNQLTFDIKNQFSGRITKKDIGEYSKIYEVEDLYIIIDFTKTHIVAICMGNVIYLDRQGDRQDEYIVLKKVSIKR